MSDEKEFLGLQRKRLPGMHMITALEGGVPLKDTLASHFFTMLHDKVQHCCLIKERLQAQGQQIEAAANKATTLENTTLGHVFGMLGQTALAAQEWSYISDDDAFIFYLLASTAIDETQRWINRGKEDPYTLATFGPLVERPAWAASFGVDSDEGARKHLEYVSGLLLEVQQANPSSTS